MFEVKGEEERIEVNRKLITRLKQYVMLLHNSVDERGVSFAEGFQDRISVVERSGFRDFVTILDSTPKH